MRVVILCGGHGSRLWPLSTSHKPKQFLKLFQNQSLFQKTILRNLKITNDFIIVVNKDQLSICKDQASEIEANYTFIVEPVSKNTAPAITIAALLIKDDAALIVPSDHMISSDIEYLESIQQAEVLALDNAIIMFGIVPTYPNTQYGYIEYENSKVISFKEKPSFETASKYYESKFFLWNSGIFLLDTLSFLQSMKRYCPQLLGQIINIYEKRAVIKNTINLPADLMSDLSPISIDYALMEKVENIAVVPTKFKWSDMGTFKYLYKELYQDEADIFNFNKKRQ